MGGTRMSSSFALSAPAGYIIAPSMPRPPLPPRPEHCRRRRRTLSPTLAANPYLPAPPLARAPATPTRAPRSEPAHRSTVLPSRIFAKFSSVPYRTFR
ncbi:hypothetical protein EVAR_27575_1 [Eumeta japonica]|uniref:Uncharacterized protein n=1 Tax=Eumeta variegata TaxID=151549 RepID=A0A4C1W9X8_EUMVA|nr:hypothetical protein EVAR_27575_1 [Eumeta japonica]